MVSLIADRFLSSQVVGAPGSDGGAIDLATGSAVRIRIDAAGTHADQQTWTEGCARAHAAGTLVDFGFIGAARRFEARAPASDPRRNACAEATGAVAEWLEQPRPSSSRLLRLAELPDPRLVRQRGFVPCDVALIDAASYREDLCLSLAGRSVVLLDSRGVPDCLALALLRLRRIGVREFRAVAQCMRPPRSQSLKAAEGRASYGGRSPLSDSRTARMIVEADRLVMRGRHAAAERALTSAVMAFDRRADFTRAGNAGIRLGCLLLARGRPDEARAVFTDAHDRFQRVRAAEEALEAMAYVGLAQTDLAQFDEAEQSCRSAFAAATALGRPEAVLLPALALVRSLLWQRRHADARSLLEAVTPVGDPEQCARYWCLAARLRIAVDAIPEAWRDVERARPAASGLSPAIESVVRRCEAAVQGRLGDVDALRVHVFNGLAAARAARLPLQTIKLRLTHIEGLHRAERLAQARAAARHLGDIRSRALPPLLKSRIDSVMSGLDTPPLVREASARFQVTTFAGDVQDFDGLRDLLTISHQVEDESEALVRTATAIRRHTHAAGVGIFGWHSSTPQLLASSGASSTAMARRSIDIGQSIRPERSNGSGGWMEAAVPIHYLGRIIGAVAMRWNMEGPENTERALAFASASATACAPLVFVLIERHGMPVAPAAAFDLVGVSPAIEEVRKVIARAANAPFTVLLEGESGSGKELVARALHRAGCRRDRRFSALNCAAMPEDLVDAELFGHAKGAFTGATGERLGLFESADGGTVFLDEVRELSARAQAKVLRVLQEGEIRRIGENVTRPFDARLVAATNRPLRAEVEAGRFRQDLLYRLDVIRINVPPLRERVEDIPLLAAGFWRQSAERIGSKAVLGQSAVCALARYDWPGNVRELQNVLTALVVAVPPRGVVGASELPAAIARAAQVSSHESLESARLKFEERFVRAALARAAGHRGKTAAALGLSRQGLAKLMQRLHLDA